MKKRVPWYVALLIVVAVIATCGVIYSRLPITPTAPIGPKGSNRPPPGLHANKIATDKAAESKKADKAAPDEQKDSNAANRTAESKKADKTAPDEQKDSTAAKKPS